MKIIIINGSPRISGATGQILSKIREEITKGNPDTEIEYVDLAKMNLSFCTGSAFCYKTGACHNEKDGLENLSRKIEECDGVVFGSPTYASNVSGLFKVLIDRGHFVFEQLLKNKACFSVVTYENYGGGKALKIINELIRFSGGALSCKYLLKLNHGEKALNEKRNKQIEKLCHKFICKIKKKNPLSLFENVLRAAVFKIGINPHVFSNRQRYEGVINRWVKRGIITEGG